MTKSLNAFLVLFLATSLAQPALAAPRNSVDPKVPIIAGIGGCESASQLDCIESITVIDTDGGSYVAKQTNPLSGQSDVTYGQTIEESNSDWSFTNKSGQEIGFSIDANLTTPSYVVFGSAGDDPNNPNTVTPNVADTRFYEPKLKVSVEFSDVTPSVENPALDRQVEINIRTSWLNVATAEMPGRNSSLVVTTIPGGSKITVRGSRVIYYQEIKAKSQLTGDVTKQIVGNDNFTFELTHGYGNLAKCAKAGAIESNTNAMNMDIEDLTDSSSMAFRLTGIKLNSTGGTNVGFLNVKVPLAWLTCKDSQNLLPYGTKFKTTYIYGDGSKSDGKESSNVSVVNGYLLMKFDNFPLAKTEIKVSTDEKTASAAKEAITAKLKAEAEAKAKAEAKVAPAPTATPGSDTKSAANSSTGKKITITCVKGKSTKKISAVDPKCPSGFKKK